MAMRIPISFEMSILRLKAAIIVLMSGLAKAQIDTSATTSVALDPCYSYSTVDDAWRSILGYSFDYRNDSNISWNGWYRLYLNGKSAQFPESCVNYIRCGGYTPLYLNGSHPRLEDGIVTREVLGSAISRCGYYTSSPVQIKACPGDYYVYQLEKPYDTIPNPVYCTVAYTRPSVDPCTNYTVLDQTWRGTNTSAASPICDRSIEFAGWYRLFYNGISVQMPEYCVAWGMCSTSAPLWLKGPHPRVEDGVVIRQVCGSWGLSDCCNYKSPPIQVKACPGNYYVYEFVKPPPCSYAYCSDVRFLNASGSSMLSNTTMEYQKPLGVIGVRIKVVSSRDLAESFTDGTFTKQLQEELMRRGAQNITSIKLRHFEKTNP